MGIKERRVAQKEALKQEIIAAARTLFKEEGSWQGVTIRKIASAINYSLPTIYEYFSHKEELLRVLQHEGYATLCSMIKRQLEISKDDPYGILSLAAQAYWDFAEEHPELYLVMHSQQNAAEDNKEAIAYIRAVVKEALQNIAVMGKTTKFSEAELNDKIDSMRGIIHGFIMLALARGMAKERAHSLMMQTLNESIKAPTEEK